MLVRPSRNSRSQMFFQIDVLKNVGKSHRKTLVLEPLFNKVAGLKTCNVIKKRLQHKCFPLKFAKILRTSFFMENLQCFIEEQWSAPFVEGPIQSPLQAKNYRNLSF